MAKNIDFFNDDSIAQATKAQINAYFRANDTSNYWPICNRFDATERAIRQIRKRQKVNCRKIEGLEYFLVLQKRIAYILNNAK